MTICENFIFQDQNKITFQKKKKEEFPRGPVVRTQYSQCCGLGSVSGGGTKIPQVARHS